MLTEPTYDALASGSDTKSSDPTPVASNRGPIGAVGVVGCMTGSGTQSTAVVGA